MMQRFCVLMYHMIAEPASLKEQHFACPPARFSKHMQALLRKGYQPVSLRRIAAYLNKGAALPEKPIVITLDDGYADNYSHAFPVFRQHNIPATIFLVTNTIGDVNRWEQDERAPRRAMLTWPQIQEMQQAGIEFGSHTLNHPRLTRIPETVARAEIHDAKRILEDRLGEPVDWFAYPYGDYNERILAITREAGYRLACSVRAGFNRADVEPLLLRRIDVAGTDNVWQLLQKIRYGTNEASRFGPLHYYSRRLLHKAHASLKPKA